MTKEQLVTLYDENTDVNVQMLADNFGYELEAVKMILASGSTRYRKEMRKDETVFSDDDFELAKKTMVRLMQDSEVDAVKLRAANFVINEHLGRNKMENAKNLGGNINVINIHVQKAREALARSKGQLVEVEATKELQAA
jgi:hypothetical protein